MGFLALLKAGSPTPSVRPPPPPLGEEAEKKLLLLPLEKKWLPFIQGPPISPSLGCARPTTEPTVVASPLTPSWGPGTCRRRWGTKPPPVGGVMRNWFFAETTGPSSKIPKNEELNALVVGVLRKDTVPGNSSLEAWRDSLAPCKAVGKAVV